MSVEFRTFADEGSLCDAAAREWLALLPAGSGPFSVAVSGGRIAKTCFAAVASAAKASGQKLSQVDFFWADERCVPATDPESNFRLAQENLFTPLNLPSTKIHRLKGEIPPENAVTEANADIRQTAPSNSEGIPVLDLILLGLGEDGHTASLMPNALPEVKFSRAPFVHVPNSPKPPPNRITMTYPVLAAARNVWMLATGAGKADALRKSLSPDGQTPFADVLRSRSKTVIYTDLNEITAEWSKR